jgi:hypothetical protein
MHVLNLFEGASKLQTLGGAHYLRRGGLNGEDLAEGVLLHVVLRLHTVVDDLLGLFQVSCELLVQVFKVLHLCFQLVKLRWIEV